MHSLETSFIVKKSTHVQELSKKETAKNYSAAQIFHAIRGAGTEAGTLLLDAAGGAFPKMQEQPRPPALTPPPSQQ